MDKDIALLRSSLHPLPEPVPKPVLVVLIGLPGTGKSHFAAQLAARFPLAVLESDFLRKVLFPTPAYTPAESTRLFATIHALLRELLAARIPTLLDATNLIEANRRILYRIATEADARLALVRLTAPEALVRNRLDARLHAGGGRKQSDADWEVYQRMRHEEEPVEGRHYHVDTSGDIRPTLRTLLRELRRWSRPQESPTDRG